MAVDEEHLFITWLSLEALHLLGSFVEFSLGERERNGMGAEWERSRGGWRGNAALLAGPPVRLCSYSTGSSAGNRLDLQWKYTPLNFFSAQLSDHRWLTSSNCWEFQQGPDL